MSITAGTLRELHRIHRQISDLRERLARGPKQIRMGQGNVTRLESELEQAKEALKKGRMAADEKQLQLKGREDRVVELQGKLNSCASNREYQALKEQIAADEKANSVLADEILEILEKLDQHQEEIQAKNAALEKARRDLGNLRQKVQQQQDQLEMELARVNEQLQQAESKLPADFKSDYDRIVKARGEEALAPLVEGSCGSCHQMVTPQTLNELALLKPVVCKNCGSLLYLPEDKSP